jgi:hypothetical protein
MPGSRISRPGYRCARQQQVAQAAGQFDGALRGLRREPMRLNGADADPDVLRVRTMSPHRDSRPADRLPRGPAGLWDQVRHGEPLDRLGVHPHRLARLTLGRKAEPERVDLGLEHSRS